MTASRRQAKAKQLEDFVGLFGLMLYASSTTLPAGAQESEEQSAWTLAWKLLGININNWSTLRRAGSRARSP
jgi:hypothetical protein